MSLNKVQIIGNVGNITIKDVKGVKVANLSVATNERAFKTKSGKEVPEHTEWHRVVLWRNLAEVAEKNIKVGTQIYVDGKINSSMYTDAQGVERMSYNIVAERFQILGKQEKANKQAPQTENFPADVKNNTQNVNEEQDENDGLPF
jgi:single-strand DNA-binding protein